MKSTISSMVMFVFLIVMSGCERTESLTKITVTLTNASTEDIYLWANYERPYPSNKLKPGVKREKVFTYQTKANENTGYTISVFAGKNDGKFISKNFVLITNKPADQLQITFDGVNLLQAD